MTSARCGIFAACLLPWTAERLEDVTFHHHITVLCYMFTYSHWALCDSFAPVHGDATAYSIVSFCIVHRVPVSLVNVGAVWNIIE